MYDRDFLDAAAIASLVVDILNYNENLTQSDKDDIMNRLDQQTKEILTMMQSSLEEQNDMLREISDKLDILIRSENGIKN